ncbi:MAG: hypothetical protein JW717_08540 [Marinilabiliaceae bacterium]|nr:hypothetical protein [Marinilabiliaceae bacterium]
MKIIIRYAIVLFLSGLLFACSKSDEGNNIDDVEGFAKFSKTEITVSSKEGLSSAILVWDNVEWEIETTTEESFITNISPSSGGEIGNSDITTISFTVAVNNSTDLRSQDIFAVNKSTGEKVKLTINQETLPFTVVYTNTKYQKVLGFGGMYNPAIWLSSEDRISTEELATMYDPNGKLHYSVLRLMIYPDKTKWSHDVAGALQAQNYGAIIFACPWDCTDALAEKKDMDGNGSLDKHLPEANYEAYANHLIEYVNFMKTNGVNIYAISVQNEPDMDFTFWTPSEITTFTANYGAKIRASGVKLMSPEACGFSPEYTDAVLNSSEAFTNTDIIVGHTYQGFTDLTNSYVKQRHDYICNLYPNILAPAGKSWWMTEKLFNLGENETDINKQEYKKWSYNLDALGLEMHMCMEGYCSAYIYWYLKRFYGMIGDNDQRSSVAEGEVMKNGYIMGHYSKYATGMTRIAANAPDKNILTTAYTNDKDDEITLVAINISDKPYETFLKVPKNVTSNSAIETTAEYNMKNSETVLSDDFKHIKLNISPRSIYSIRVNF